MSLLNISLEFTPVSSTLYLNEEEWINMINTFILRLNDNSLGFKFLKRLNYYLNSGYNLTIINNHSSSLTIYPKTIFINRRNIKILIPSVPYFTDAQTIHPKDFDSSSTIDLSLYGDLVALSKYKELKTKMDLNEEKRPKIKHFSCYTRQSFFMTFAHELIHCLRYFEGIHDKYLEEEATIYGIEGKSLKVEGEIITENTIRREFGLLPRISHNNRDIYIYNDNNVEVMKHFTKEDFLSI
jgi:hypothetical protein